MRAWASQNLRHEHARSENATPLAVQRLADGGGVFTYQDTADTGISPDSQIPMDTGPGNVGTVAVDGVDDDGFQTQTATKTAAQYEPGRDYNVGDRVQRKAPYGNRGTNYENGTVVAIEDENHPDHPGWKQILVDCDSMEVPGYSHTTVWDLDEVINVRRTSSRTAVGPSDEEKIQNAEKMYGTGSPQHQKAKERFAPKSKSSGGSGGQNRAPDGKFAAMGDYGDAFAWCDNNLYPNPAGFAEFVEMNGWHSDEYEEAYNAFERKLYGSFRQADGTVRMASDVEDFEDWCYDKGLSPSNGAALDAYTKDVTYLDDPEATKKAIGDHYNGGGSGGGGGQNRDENGKFARTAATWMAKSSSGETFTKGSGNSSTEWPYAVIVNESGYERVGSWCKSRDSAERFLRSNEQAAAQYDMSTTYELVECQKTNEGSKRTASLWDAMADPRHKVAGWDWDDNLAGYTAEGASAHFACVCGSNIDAPGYATCRCGKIWNAYTLTSEGATRVVCREVPNRGADVVLASRH